VLFFSTTVQQLDTEVCNHIASLLQVLAFFSCLQVGIRPKKNTALANYVMDVQLWRWKNRCYNCI